MSYSLERLNFRVLPKQRHITEAELEMMAAAQLRVSSICEPERAVSMVPNSTPAWSSSVPPRNFGISVGNYAPALHSHMVSKTLRRFRFGPILQQ